jgi:hypothetical protein
LATNLESSLLQMLDVIILSSGTHRE